MHKCKGTSVKFFPYSLSQPGKTGIRETNTDPIYVQVLICPFCNYIEKC